MNDITNRVIEKLKKANTCGRYSNATVEKAVEEVLEEKRREGACCSKKEEPKKQKPLTLKEALDVKGAIDVNKHYRQALIIVEEDDGIATTYFGNELDTEDRLDFYEVIKTNLQDMTLEGIPNFIVKLYETIQEED